MRFMISSALDVIIQIVRLTDGTRKIQSVKEVTGMEGDVVTMQDIFVYERKGIGPDSKERGHFRATGVRPRFADKLELVGFELPEDIFDAHRIFE